MSTEFSDDPVTEDDGVFYDEEVTPEHGILGFTLRELLIVAVWLVIFVTSFFPLYAQISGTSIWMRGISWILPIGLPTVAVFLIVLRRFSPEGIRRVGSLGIDQFASVAFSVAAVYWASTIWESIAAMAVQGYFLLSWVMIVQFIGALALVALTVFAPFIPGLREDFQGRLVTLAHRNANPARPVIARPRPEAAVLDGSPQSDASDAPEASETGGAEPLDLLNSVPLTSHASGGALGMTTAIDDDYVPGYARSARGNDADRDADSDAFTDAEIFEPEPESFEHDVSEPVSSVDSIVDEDVEATADAAAHEQSAAATQAVSAGQPFWALAPDAREIVDEQGQTLFQIGPEAWALVLEDRGETYVVRHDDGRVGYLHDINDITKG
ncbi:hypothetical protein ACW5CM_09020 [Microbacterium sp. A588]